MPNLNTFESALAAHLQAIEARNITAFEATLTKAQALTFVQLDGKLTKTKAEFVTHIRAWFEDKDWSWELEPLSSTAVAQTGVAIFKVHYKDKDREGKPYELKYSLTLVFAKEGAEWRLVHDQNGRAAQ
jgi:ketosteroid isomerase-like protein